MSICVFQMYRDHGCIYYQINQQEHLMDAGSWDSNGIKEAWENSRAVLDGLKQRFLICRKDMVASTSLPHDDDDDDEKMPAPHRLIVTYWESDQIREAFEKSRAALDDLIKPISSPTDPTGDHQIRKVAKVENLFLTIVGTIDESLSAMLVATSVTLYQNHSMDSSQKCKLPYDNNGVKKHHIHHIPRIVQWHFNVMYICIFS